MKDTQIDTIGSARGRVLRVCNDGFTPFSVSPTSDFASETSSSASMSEAGSSEPNTSLSPVNASTSFSSHETSGDSLGDISADQHS